MNVSVMVLPLFNFNRFILNTAVGQLDKVSKD